MMNLGIVDITFQFEKYRKHYNTSLLLRLVNRTVLGTHS